MTCLADVKKPFTICLDISTEYGRVADGQTSCHSIVRAMHTRRAVKFAIFDQYIALFRK